MFDKKKRETISQNIHKKKKEKYQCFKLMYIVSLLMHIIKLNKGSNIIQQDTYAFYFH